MMLRTMGQILHNCAQFCPPFMSVSHMNGGPSHTAKSIIQGCSSQNVSLSLHYASDCDIEPRRDRWSEKIKNKILLTIELEVYVYVSSSKPTQRKFILPVHHLHHTETKKSLSQEI